VNGTKITRSTDSLTLYHAARQARAEAQGEMLARAAAAIARNTGRGWTRLGLSWRHRLRTRGIVEVRLQQRRGYFFARCNGGARISDYSAGPPRQVGAEP